MNARLTVTLVSAVAIAGFGLTLLFWQRDSSPTGSAQSELDRVNAKRALNGLPTFGPGEVDLSRPNIFPTVEIPTHTPGPSPTPWAPSCGPQEGPESAMSLVERYGELRTDCGLYLGTEWLITTRGLPGKPGVIAILSCPDDDSECLAGRKPASGAQWEIFPFPYLGAVKIFAFHPPSTLLLGGVCFDLFTRQYDLDRPCLDKPVPVPTAEPQ